MATAKQKLKMVRYMPLVVERTVETVYYGDYHASIVLRKTKSLDACRATAKVTEYLRRQHYPGAMLAQVYDLVSGKLYAVVKMDVTGAIHTIFQAIADKRDRKDQLKKELKAIK